LYLQENHDVPARPPANSGIPLPSQCDVILGGDSGGDLHRDLSLLADPSLSMAGPTGVADRASLPAASAAGGHRIELPEDGALHHARIPFPVAGRADGGTSAIGRATPRAGPANFQDGQANCLRGAEGHLAQGEGEADPDRLA